MDPGAPYRSLGTEIDAAVREVLSSGRFVLGPNVAELEREIAAYLGVKHAIGVASGTDALLLALRAAGIGPGDDVLIPAFTFLATASAVLLAGARPVLVDVNPTTYCLDVQQLVKRVTPRSKAVIPVHLYGHPVAMTELMEFAWEWGLKVIEDNAQAFGAAYEGRKTGGIGDIGCLSFFPSENLGACGDGGMVTTNDGVIAERIRMLRTHGWRQKHFPELLGYNSRLDEMQAAILRVKLRHVDGWNERRRELARLYDRRFAQLGIAGPVETLSARHVYHLYSISLPNRDRVIRVLQQKGIASGVYYPRPLHRTSLFAPLGFGDGAFPVAERASRELLALPLYPEMTAEQVDEVVDAVAASLAESALVPAGVVA